MSKPLLQKLSTLLDSGELLEIVDASTSSTAVLLALGYSKKGQYIKIVKDFLDANDVDTSHFLDSGLAAFPPIEKDCPVCGKHFILPYSSKATKQVTCSYSCSNTLFRSGEHNPNWKGGVGYRDKAIKVYGCKCQKCGFENPYAIQVHHIDSNRENNSIENLIVLCANCHLIEHEGKQYNKWRE